MKPFNLLASALVITFTAGAAMAERINMTSNASVATSVERLTNAVKAAVYHRRLSTRCKIGR